MLQRSQRSAIQCRAAISAESFLARKENSEIHATYAVIDFISLNAKENMINTLMMVFFY